MDDFKYDAGKLEAHATLHRIHRALRENNPLLALHYTNEYFNALDIQYHVDSALKLYKEKLTNDE
jgi:hypothetical protein